MSIRAVDIPIRRYPAARPGRLSISFVIGPARGAGAPAGVVSRVSVSSSPARGGGRGVRCSGAARESAGRHRRFGRPGGGSAGHPRPLSGRPSWVSGGAGVADQAWREGEAPAGGGPGGPLSGRVAIVTGAAGGLGGATWQALRRVGAAVVRVDVHGYGSWIADVAPAEGNRAMVDLVLDRHGRLDILVLNAGAQAMTPIASYCEADWDRLMNLMVKGPFLAMKFAWPHLTRRPG